MNKKRVTLVSLGMRDDIKTKVKNVITQLEKYNYAYVDNGSVSRQISKNIPKYFKEQNIIMLGKTENYSYMPSLCIVFLDHQYKIEVIGEYTFYVLKKESNENFVNHAKNIVDYQKKANPSIF